MKSIPRPEYPNPIFEREDWQNLNGYWDFEIDNGNSGEERGLYKNGVKLSQSIKVPFCPESPLSGINNKDFMTSVWYKRTVKVTAQQLDNRVFIHFGAVDFFTTVYINSEKAGTHFGGYASFSFEITHLLKEGENFIAVHAQDDTRSPMQARGKQSELFYSHGCDYTRTTGIWQTVYLEFVPKSYIKSVRYFPNTENSSVLIEAQLCGEGTFEARAYFNGKQVGYSSAKAVSGDTVFCPIELSEKHLWELGTGGLYDLDLSFCLDKVKSYFGLRRVNIENGKFLLNGESTFMRMVLDQGFYPDGIYTAPTEEALIRDIELSMSVGFNGARLHQKIFEPRFLYHCDRLGYMVWGEHGNWGIDISDFTCLKYYLPEWLEALERDFNHPSIIGWCPFNETWDYKGRRQDGELIRTVYLATKAYDKTRPCIDTSGNFHVQTDIYDIHDYEQNPTVFFNNYNKFMTGGELFESVLVHHPARQKHNGEPVFMSEYGGIKWSEDEGDKKAWGYGNAPKTKKEFFERYEGLTGTLLDNDKFIGFCYTQLTDVEQEQNGIFTYDRKPKFDKEVLKKINSRKARIEKDLL
ncbi:MAG: Beta-glucuronidase [Firmicutes bacterium ADurb.Bin300]|nr:MAG: Beta-glucuronidase [Firmicutes bacterium ADurb.Bin300]HOD01920.1 glycoside hydrolase family 2 TIM barrel-domain containing protein [Clostridiales bacterium]